MNLCPSYSILTVTIFFQLLGACSSNSGPTAQNSTAKTSPDSTAVREASRQYRVHYNSPVDLDSTDFYYQPISVVPQEQEIRSRTFSSDSYETGEPSGIEGTCFNILFFQKSTLLEHALLPDSKSVIIAIDDHMKPDPRWPYLFYTITKADTNADGNQDEEDASALFVSDRSGYHLRQLTPDGTHLEGKMILVKAQLLLIEVRPDTNQDHAFTHADGTCWLRFNLTNLGLAPVRQPAQALAGTLKNQMLERQSRLAK